MIWVGSLTGKSMLADTLAMLFLSSDFLKGAPFAMAILLIWQIPFEKEDRSHRIYALRMFLSVLLSVLAARISQAFIYSPRPIMVKEIADHFSDFAKSYRLDWNSFPSDHLSLYFPIALMTYLKFRKMGIVLILWSLLCVGLPRIFIGRHYPSDVLGGIIVGTSMFALVWSLKSRIDPFLEKIANRLELFPKFSLSFVFLFCFLIATVFDGARHILSSAKQIFVYAFMR